MLNLIWILLIITGNLWKINSYNNIVHSCLSYFESCPFLYLYRTFWWIGSLYSGSRANTSTSESVTCKWTNEIRKKKTKFSLKLLSRNIHGHTCRCTQYVLGNLLKKYVLVNIKKLHIDIHINNVCPPKGDILVKISAKLCTCYTHVLVVLVNPNLVYHMCCVHIHCTWYM